MSMVQKVREQLRSFPAGTIITLDDFKLVGSSRAALAMALTRLTKEGEIRRIRRGLYLKPKTSRFGALPPTSEAMIAGLGMQGKKSYTSGLLAFNKLGLTTQIPNILTLRGGNTTTRFNINGTKFEIKAGRSPKSKRDVPLMVLLDSIREIKNIPDTNLIESIQILKQKISDLTRDEKVRLVTLALDDKPMVKALLGAILDEMNPELTNRIQQSLNTLTTYKLGQTNLIFASKWKIK